MNVLVLGSGGREHTFAWKIAKSPLCADLYVAPGNSGTASIATNLDISVTDFEGIKSAVLSHNIEMLVVGPEDPLVNGVHDFFLNDDALKHVAVIGPQKAAATLEGSKEFAKEFLFRHNIPTAAYQSFTANDLEKGFSFLETLSPPYVLKADGLAAGKGVLIIDNLDEAKSELKNMLVDSKFGNASSKVVIEEFLDGPEVSLFGVSDGTTIVPLTPAQDFKRVDNNDEGPNTGGMGAYSPLPWAPKNFVTDVTKNVLQPMVDEMSRKGIPFQGLLFAGLAVTSRGVRVIEFNARFGDPETQVVLARLNSSLSELLIAAATGKLSSLPELDWKSDSAVTVVMAAEGYPDSPKTGATISGIAEVEKLGLTVFHAGTKSNESGEILVNGGRVLSVTATGSDLSDARHQIYAGIERIEFDGEHHRSDIALKAALGEIRLGDHS